jgi:hypothetical protein
LSRSPVVSHRRDGAFNFKAFEIVRNAVLPLAR